MDTIKFKTGREYTEHGQRIVARLLENGNIVFLDIDRGIDGVISANGFSREDVKELFFNRSGVMDAYDNGNYNMSDSLSRRELITELTTIAQTI
jgi:hypothetical protein